MNRWWHRALSLALPAVLASAVAASLAPPAAAQVVVRDDRGTELRLAAAPRRIVSLLPSLTETVCGLGGCARLVGVDRYSNWPAEVARLPQLGGLDDPLLERIAALRPDVVLASTSARVTERLRALGLTVLLFESKTHADVRHSMAQVAALLGTPDEGERAWGAIERSVQDAAARVPAALRGRRVYFEIGPTPYAAGTASFIGQTLQRLGLANIVPAEMGPFPQLSPEFVLRARPDIVIAGARDLQSMPQRPGWQALPALQGPRPHTCGLDAAHYDLLVRPGPRLGEAAQALADCLVAMERR